MTARGLLDILNGMPFNVYIANLIALPINLQMFMIVAYASSVPTCIIHTRVDELHMLTDEFPIRMQLYKLSSNPTKNDAGYKPPERS